MLNHDIVRSMNIDRAVETPMNSTTPHIRPRHVTEQMKMNSIATQPIGLAHIVQFDVGDPGCEVILVLFWSVHQDLSSELGTSALLAETTLEAGLGHELACLMKDIALTVACTCIRERNTEQR